MEEIIHDLHYAWRKLRRNPSFCVLAIVVLATGIGVTSGAFTIMESVLMRPLPFQNPKELVEVRHVDRRQANITIPPSIPDVLEWRDHAAIPFEAIAIRDPKDLMLTGTLEPQRVPGDAISVDFFELLGVQARIGRTFLPEEGRLGNHHVAILGNDLWRGAFAGVQGIVGRSIQLDGTSYEVVGVLPGDLPYPLDHAQIWVPWIAEEHSHFQSRSLSSVYVFARLTAGRSRGQAEMELNALAKRLGQEYSEDDIRERIVLISLHDQAVGSTRRVLWLLFAASLVILLISWANTSNLLVAWVASRETELVIRASLGASPIRLFRELMAENVLLSVPAGIAGFLLGYGGVKYVLTLSTGMARIPEVGIDRVVLGYVCAVTLLSGVVVGLIPYLIFLRPHLLKTLSVKGGFSADRRRDRMRASLVIAEIALAMFLLSAAGLMTKSFVQLLDLDPGFKTSDLLVMRIELPSNRYGDESRQRLFHERLLGRLRRMQGAEDVEVATQVPFGWGLEFDFFAAGKERRSAGEGLQSAHVVGMSCGYTRVMGIPLEAGRLLSQDEISQELPVMLISRMMARRLWPNEDAIGQYAVSATSGDWYQVVGVVSDVKQVGLRSEIRPAVYLPVTRAKAIWMHYIIRTSGTHEKLVPAAKAQVWALDKDIPVTNIATMRERVQRELGELRFYLTIAGIFATLAVILSATGAFAVASFLASQRTREFGIRMALGAQRNDIMRLVISKAATLAVAGVALGLACAFALTRYITSLLYNVSPTDTATYVVTSFVLFSISILASIVPAVRASRIEPMHVLRHE